MSVSVRPAVATDVAAIVALEAEAFPLDPWSASLVGEGVAGTVPTVSYLVAEHEGAFAGYAVLSVVDTDAELQRIAVPAPLRRAGVAAALLEGVRAAAAAGGAARLLLEVREDNAPARRLYERDGFTELGRRPRYYRDGTDALVLSAAVTMEP